MKYKQLIQRFWLIAVFPILAISCSVPNQEQPEPTRTYFLQGEETYIGSNNYRILSLQVNGVEIVTELHEEYTALHQLNFHFPLKKENVGNGIFGFHFSAKQDAEGNSDTLINGTTYRKNFVGKHSFISDNELLFYFDRLTANAVGSNGLLLYEEGNPFHNPELDFLEQERVWDYQRTTEGFLLMRQEDTTEYSIEFKITPR